MSYTLKPKDRIYFIGIGGIGMSGLAMLCHSLGFCVSGSDKSHSAIIQKLQDDGIDITIGHNSQTANESDVIVYSSAITAQNTIISYAKNHNKTILKRAELLACLLGFFKTNIAITGTHGKTTVTGMIMHILIELLYKPSYLVGGIFNSKSNQAKLDSKDIFVFEADESDASFLYYKPNYLIINNIDNDHMENYNNDYNTLVNSFENFANQACKKVYFCIDDDGCNKIDIKDNLQVSTYGFAHNADIRAIDVVQNQNNTKFQVCIKNTEQIENFTINTAGNHNIINTLAAVSFCLDLGISLNSASQAMANYSGVKRRFDIYKCKSGNKDFSLIDDYGHHPTEVTATLSSVKQRFGDSRLIHIFELHRYSRTKQLYSSWLSTLSSADILILLPTYSASESIIVGAEHYDIGADLINLGSVCHVVENYNEAYILTQKLLKDNDVVLMQGAGSVAKLKDFFIDEE